MADVGWGDTSVAGWGSGPAAKAKDTGNAWGIPVEEAKDDGGGWDAPGGEVKDDGAGWGVSVKEAEDGGGGWGVPVKEAKDDGGDWGVQVGEAKDEDGGWGATIGAEDGGGGGGWGKEGGKRGSDGPDWGGKDAKRPRGEKEKGGESELPDFLALGCPDEVVQRKIDIPPGSTGKIIGKQGATIKALQDCIPGYVQIRLDKESNQVTLASDNVACVEKAEMLIETLLARSDARNWRPDVSVSCLQASQGESRLVLHRLPKDAISRCLREFVSLTRDVYVFQSAEAAQAEGAVAAEGKAVAAAEKEAQPGGVEAKGGANGGPVLRRSDSRLVCVDWVGGKAEALLPGFAEVIKAAASTYRKGTHVKVQAQIVKSFFRPRLGPGCEGQLEASISASAEEMQEYLASGSWTLQSSNPYDEESIAVARAALEELGFVKLPVSDTVSLHLEHNENRNKYAVSVKLPRDGEGDGDVAAAEENGKQQQQQQQQIKFKKSYKRHAFFSFLRGCPDGEFRLLVKTRPAGDIMAEPFDCDDTAEIEEIVRGAIGERTSDGLCKIPAAGGEYTHAVTVVRYKGVEVFCNKEYKVVIKRVRMQAADKSEVISRWEVTVESLPLKEHLLSGSVQPEEVSSLLGGLVAFTTRLTQTLGAVGCLKELDSIAPECPAVDQSEMTPS